MTLDDVRAFILVKSWKIVLPCCMVLVVIISISRIREHVMPLKLNVSLGEGKNVTTSSATIDLSKGGTKKQLKRLSHSLSHVHFLHHHHHKKPPTLPQISMTDPGVLTKEFYASEGIKNTTTGKTPHLTLTKNNSTEIFTYNLNWNKYNKQNEVVAFYNLFIGNKDLYPSIVEEQLSLMNYSGLLKALDVVYYVTIGNHSHTMPNTMKTLLKKKKVGTNSQMFVQIRNTHKSVDETLTLSYLYDFCLQHPASKVLYFHNKGSYNYRGENVFFRQFLDCYVLNPECIDALNEGFDICGLRLSPVPSPHYSGNFWWATCSYVNKLVSPVSLYFNSTFANVTNNLPKGIVSFDRFFAESWVASYPTVNAADCMDHTVDTTFLCCYDIDYIPLKINNSDHNSGLRGSSNTNSQQLVCPNHAKQFVSNKSAIDDIHYYMNDVYPLIQKKLQSLSDANGVVKMGAKCKAADVFENGEYYADMYQYRRGPVEFYDRFDMIETLRKRALLWYGQEPTPLLKAVEKLDVLPTLPNRALIIGRMDGKVHYWYNDGILHNANSKEFQLVVNSLKPKRQNSNNNNKKKKGKTPTYTYINSLVINNSSNIEKVIMYEFLMNKLATKLNSQNSVPI